MLALVHLGKGINIFQKKTQLESISQIVIHGRNFIDAICVFIADISHPYRQRAQHLRTVEFKGALQICKVGLHQKCL